MPGAAAKKDAGLRFPPISLEQFHPWHEWTIQALCRADTQRWTRELREIFRIVEALPWSQGGLSIGPGLKKPPPLILRVL